MEDRLVLPSMQEYAYMKTKFSLLFCLTFSCLCSAWASSAAPLAKQAVSKADKVVMGYAEYTQMPDRGFKALIFDNGEGFVFRSAAPNRINTWKIKLSASEYGQLRSTFSHSAFFSLPAKMSQPKAARNETAIFIASDQTYYEVKNYSVPNTAFDTVKSKFRRLISSKIGKATRVPITELLYASKRYQSAHAASAPKTRLVKNITSDFCRSLASKQDIDYDIAKSYFLPNRYLGDVDPCMAVVNDKP
jgi:hypothetical protein